MIESKRFNNIRARVWFDEERGKKTDEQAKKKRRNEK